MNILPQKSWHVRRKENVEKVRRDEAEAEEKKLEIERRHAKAEAEALRARLGGGPKLDNLSAKEGGHLNLFWDRDFDNSEKNKATHREKEQKDETEKWARKVGISVGLNDKSEEAASHWLFGSNKGSSSEPKMKMVEEMAADKKQQKDLKRKSSEDPMNAFAMKVKRDDHGKSDYTKSDKYSAELAYEALNNSHKKSSVDMKVDKKKKKKDKKKQRHRSRQYSSDSDSSYDNDKQSDSKKSKLEQLRKERLAREEKERKRAENLLKRKNSAC